LSVRRMGLPLPSMGSVCSDQVPENTPQLGDLKRKGKARWCPGSSTPGVDQQWGVPKSGRDEYYV